MFLLTTRGVYFPFYSLFSKEFKFTKKYMKHMEEAHNVAKPFTCQFEGQWQNLLYFYTAKVLQISIYSNKEKRFVFVLDRHQIVINALINQASSEA